MRNNAKRAPPGLLARTRTHVLRFLVPSLAFFAFRPGERKAKRLDPNDMSI